MWSVRVRWIETAQVIDQRLLLGIGVHGRHPPDALALLCVDEAHVAQEGHEQVRQREEVALEVERGTEHDRALREELLSTFPRRVDRQTDDTPQLPDGV